MAITVWLTGLPSSGKTTIANALKPELHLKGHCALVIDGDEIRKGLSADLGFSPKDRHANVRRAAHLAELVRSQGVVPIVALISPYQADREFARSICQGSFLEVWVQCPLSVCENRDTHGIYTKAREGQIEGVTGIDAPYEDPIKPDLKLSTHLRSADVCVKRILSAISKIGAGGGS